MEILAKRLFDLRKERKLSQQDVAKGCEIAFTSYRRYESGEREPNASGIVAFADYFLVSADYLLGRSNKR